MKSAILDLPRSGILQARLPNKLFKLINTELVDKREDDLVNHNHNLAGHIRDEFSIKNKDIRHQSRDFINELIYEYYCVHGFSWPKPAPFYTPAHDIWARTKKPLPSYDTIMGEDRNGKVGRWKPTPMWINYMKKHEFNPVHHHEGMFSFVMFIKIPFDYEEEKKVFPPTTKPSPELLLHVPESEQKEMYMENVNGDFNIEWNNITGEQSSSSLRVDKTFEGSMLLFPALLRHSVYPFYTSDEERITISGNFLYERVPLHELKTIMENE